MVDKVDLIVEQNKDVWKTRSAFFSFIKGIIRKGWSRHAVKIKLLNKHRRQIPNPNPRGKKPTVWGCDCSVCGNTFVMSQLEVDHIVEEAASLTKLSDIQSCVEKLLVVVEDDLRIVCKACHNIVSIATSHGLTFEQAKVEKLCIEFGKLKADKQKEALLKLDKNVIMPTTAAKRVEMYRQLIKEIIVAKAEYREAQRDANCRLCDNEISKGMMGVFWYSYRNRGQHIVICPSCIKVLNNLLPTEENKTNE